MKVSKRILLLVAVLFLAAVISGCGGGESGSGNPGNGGNSNGGANWNEMVWDQGNWG